MTSSTFGAPTLGIDCGWGCGDDGFTAGVACFNTSVRTPGTFTSRLQLVPFAPLGEGSIVAVRR